MKIWRAILDADTYETISDRTEGGVKKWLDFYEVCPLKIEEVLFGTPKEKAEQICRCEGGEKGDCEGCYDYYLNLNCEEVHQK